MTLSPSAIRLLTAAVLALNGVWLTMLVGGAVAVSLDAAITGEMWMFSLYPGCACGPALYYLLRGRRTQDPTRVRSFLGTAVVLTVMGVIVLGSTLYGLIQLYPR